MSYPHPAELAVKHPDGTWFFLVYDPGDGPPTWKPLYSKDAFRELRELRLDVDHFMGTPWVAGRNSNERVFTHPGTYEFVLTEVLETEDLPVQQCKVKYRIDGR